MILDEILAHKREEIARLDLRELRSRVHDASAPRSFLDALRCASSRPALIAEIKHASPSRGVLIENFDPIELAKTYTDAGAAALSVLTDAKFFRGSLNDLTAARSVYGLPVLRKDFIIASTQVYQARAFGADAILLIAAALPDDSELADLHDLTLALGMTPLVEVHSRAELERVLRIDPLLIGINNRDLTTFMVDLETTLTLRSMIPPHIVVISESGISQVEHVERLADANIDAMLIGEALVTALDIAAKVRELTRAVMMEGAR